MEQKEGIAFDYDNKPCIAATADEEVGGEHRAVVVEGQKEDIRTEESPHGQVGVGYDYNLRRAFFLFHFICTLVPVQSNFSIKE